MEVESALVSHPLVAEAAVVGVPHEIQGEGLCCFVTMRTSDGEEGLKAEPVKHVRTQIGALAGNHMIRFMNSLPKARSCRIIRGLLRDIASGNERAQDTSTLEDYSVLAKVRGVGSVAH